MHNQPEWWDPYSCQPYKLKNEDKPRTGLNNLFEYGKVASSALLGLPAIAWQYLRLRPSPSSLSADQFVGLSISADKRYLTAMQEMVDELGVSQLLLRIPSWDTQNMDAYLETLQAFPEQQFVINILQSRDSVQDMQNWQRQVDTIIAETNSVTNQYWIGNAINRTKWGCAHTGQYLQLQDKVEELRAKYPNIKLIGGSVIDFEPLLTWRTLFNAHRYHLDANAALMYVNRRHSPFNTQYKIFDLHNKLRLCKAMTQLSNRCDDALWISETNWPLLDTKPYTPNSGHPTRTVDEKTQAEYLKLYYQIAWQSGWVDRVYWWQLINPGYGLVDHRDGYLRKMPSYYALKDIIDGELQQAPIRPDNA